MEYPQNPVYSAGYQRRIVYYFVCKYFAHFYHEIGSGKQFFFMKTMEWERQKKTISRVEFYWFSLLKNQIFDLCLVDYSKKPLRTYSRPQSFLRLKPKSSGVENVRTLFKAQNSDYLRIVTILG